MVMLGSCDGDGDNIDSTSGSRTINDDNATTNNTNNTNNRQ